MNQKQRFGLGWILWIILFSQFIKIDSSFPTTICLGAGFIAIFLLAGDEE